MKIKLLLGLISFHRKVLSLSIFLFWKTDNNNKSHHKYSIDFFKILTTINQKWTVIFCSLSISEPFQTISIEKRSYPFSNSKVRKKYRLIILEIRSVPFPSLPHFLHCRVIFDVILQRDAYNANSDSDYLDKVS